MRKSIIVLAIMVAFMFCQSMHKNYALAFLNNSSVMEDSIKADQIGSGECIVGTLYLETVCLLSGGNPQKCTAMSTGLFNLPCMLFDNIPGIDEITMADCLIGASYIDTACITCDGDGVKCMLLTMYTFYLPCLNRALQNYDEPPTSQ